LDGHLHKFLKELSPPRRNGAGILDAREVTKDLPFKKVLSTPHHHGIFREEGTSNRPPLIDRTRFPIKKGTGFFQLNGNPAEPGFAFLDGVESYLTVLPKEVESPPVRSG